ncbi:hypothetical protein VTH06DRAFT_7309 [Thermothelomyces fergusii]
MTNKAPSAGTKVTTGDAIPVTREAPGDTSNPGQEPGQPEGGGLESQRSYAGPAPTYVTNQRHRDPAGPHGKNLKEGGFEGSGTEAGPLPEPGSMEDPARIATGLAAQGRKEGGVQGKTWYTALGGDKAA